MDKRVEYPHWSERYRPQRVEDVVLPAALKRVFEPIIAQDMVPPMIFAGQTGFGKTTVARALFTQMDVDYIFINGSLHKNIDTLRTEIAEFAGTVSFNGKQKGVVIDEADYLNSNSTQPAMRAFLDEYGRNTAFILTCNYGERIIRPLRERFTVVDFRVPDDGDERKKLCVEFMERCEQILREEGVEYEPAALAELIMQHFPNWRKVINYLQRFATEHGEINAGVLGLRAQIDVEKIMGYLKARDWPNIRKWVGETSWSSDEVFRALFDSSQKYLTADGVVSLVTIIGEYQFRAHFVADQEINLAAALAEIQLRVEFK